MDNFYKVFAFILYLAFYVTAHPVYNSERDSLQDVYDKCNLVAANKIISEAEELPSNFLLDIQNENDIKALVVALTRNNDNNFSGVLGKNINLIDEDLRRKHLQDNINDLRRACIYEFVAEKRPSANMKKDAENLEILDPENFSELGIKELLRADRGQLSDQVKRKRVIGLNPTGWRKRRSDASRDTEDLDKFLRNMRELLEKREKLSFNPTGW